MLFKLDKRSLGNKDTCLQEEAGESLSDCEKDEDESLEEGCSKADDEDDSEDDFMVPDGYLSEDEVTKAIFNELVIDSYKSRLQSRNLLKSNMHFFVVSKLLIKLQLEFLIHSYN